MSQYVNDERVGEDLSEQAPRIRQEVGDLDLSLSVDPFSPAFSDVFFRGADRQSKLDEVIHLCQFGNSLVAVLGNEGVGKTRFLNEAQMMLMESAHCCTITASVMSTAEDIFQQIATQLQLPLSSSASAGEVLVALRNVMSEGHASRVVIIVDDAHYLNDSILSALISLLQGQGNQFHLLVSGSHDLVERIDQFQMVDVLTYDIVLEPLLKSEVKAYVELKLAAVSFPDGLGLDDKQIEQIARESGGYPGAINDIARALLFQQDIGADDSTKTSGLPLLHMSLLVVLLAALIMALFYMGDDEAELDQAVVTPDINVVSDEELGESTALVQQGGAEKDASGVEPESLVVTPESSTAEVAKPNIVDGAINQPALPVSQLQQNTTVDSSVEANAVKALSVENNLKAPKPLGTGSQKKSFVADDGSELSDSLKQELVEEVKRLTVDGPKSGRVGNLTESERLVLSWPEDTYVLQVIGASQVQGLQQFIRTQPNRSQLYLVGIGRNGQPWHVVINGPYADRDQARQAIQRLPQNQVNSGPWVRPVSEVKRKIKEFRNK